METDVRIQARDEVVWKDNGGGSSQEPKPSALFSLKWRSLGGLDFGGE